MEYLGNMFLSMAIIVNSINCMYLRNQLVELEEKVEQIENVCIIDKDTMKN